MKQYDVVALGESLIDFVPIDDELLGRFKATPGGAPANVAYGLAKLGNKVALVSRVGNDPLGSSIVKTMKNVGVDTNFIQQDQHRLTTLTIVMPKSEDMLRYAIYRNNSADGALSYEEVPVELITNTKILHCGSLSMSSPTSNQTTLKAIQEAKKHDVVISVDVNLRPNSWDSREEMIMQSTRLIELSDIVKMTREESLVLNLNPEEIARNTDKIILITDGEEGAKLYHKDIYVKCEAPSVDVVDATGAGDAFTSAFLHFYLKYIHVMELKELLTYGVRFAVKAGSEIVQRHGAFLSLSDLESMLQFERELSEVYEQARMVD